LRAFLILLALLSLTLALYGHGSTVPPPPPDPPPEQPPAPPLPPMPPPPIPPPRPVPPGPPTPGPRPPVPPIPVPKPDPRPPEIPDQPDTETPREDPRKGIRPNLKTPYRTRKQSASPYSWRLWWEYNREHLLGLRSLKRREVTFTGKGETRRVDALGEHRAEVHRVLREIATGNGKRRVRAAALIALGRIGDDEDTHAVVMLLRDKEQHREIHEAAATALVLLPAIESDETRSGVRDYFLFALDNRGALPRRARGMLVIATGRRAAFDTRLRMELLGRSRRKLRNAEEATHLTLALGLTSDAFCVPELATAVRRGEFGSRGFSDVQRSHAAYALARVGGAGSARTLAMVLDSRRSGLETRRACALALGRLLRERRVDPEEKKRAERSLQQAFAKGQDSLLRGFAAVALGAAREPKSLTELTTAIDHGGNKEIKPFCALALGFAARDREGDRYRKLRTFLKGELAKTNDPELESAYCIAIGLAGAKDASDELGRRVVDRRRPAGVRGAAAQGLGLLADPDPEAVIALETILRKERSVSLLPDVALALGLMQRRDVAPDLVKMIAERDSEYLRGRLILALSHLEHPDTVPALLGILNDKKHAPMAREFAAVALGLLGETRDEDPMFALDAWFNFMATTESSHELVRLY
jgi:HEAT repeat protein